MAEWHLDPVYIAENWTDEMLQVMIEKLAERKERINKALSGNQPKENVVSDHKLFKSLGKRLKVVKKPDYHA